jgi:D-lactate dehydrogenase
MLADQLENILPADRIKARLIDRYAYASDASHFYLVPKLVVQPINIEEVQKLFQFSHLNQEKLTFRAAGTSFSGQGVTDGILADLSNYWRRVTPEQGGKTVRVQLRTSALRNPRSNASSPQSCTRVLANPRPGCSRN